MLEPAWDHSIPIEPSKFESNACHRHGNKMPPLAPLAFEGLPCDARPGSPECGVGHGVGTRSVTDDEWTILRSAMVSAIDVLTQLELLVASHTELELDDRHVHVGHGIGDRSSR